MMATQQECVIKATQESMTNLLKELKRGRNQQIEVDNEERARLVKEQAERDRVQRDIEERQLALREEELKTA